MKEDKVRAEVERLQMRLNLAMDPDKELAQVLAELIQQREGLRLALDIRNDTVKAMEQRLLDGRIVYEKMQRRAELAESFASTCGYGGLP